MFLTVDVGAERKINTELFELSGLPEKPGQNSTGNFPGALVIFARKRHSHHEKHSLLHHYCCSGRVGTTCSGRAQNIVRHLWNIPEGQDGEAGHLRPNQDHVQKQLVQDAWNERE